MNYPHLSLFVKRVTHSQSQEIIFILTMHKLRLSSIKVAVKQY